mgnify:CR=1 FL=1
MIDLISYKKRMHINGEDKDQFYIFDFCGNFEFFRMSEGKSTAVQIALQGAIFSLKAQIIYKLQDLAYQTEELIAFRTSLVEDLVRKVRELNKENFAVRQHLRYVEQYANPDNYNSLTYEDTLLMAEELAPLITPDEDEASAVRFDALMYGIELAYLAGKKYSRARTDLYKKVSGIASVANIPEIMVQSELINKILHTDYLDNAGINEFEHIRENLRDLMKYIPRTGVKYITNFDDEILSVEWNESDLESDDLKNYKAKAEFYIRQHQDEAAIAKLKSNVPLSAEDVKALERILWSEVGSKKDYEAEYGEKPLGEFVREIVGLDMTAAKAAFAEYLNDVNLDADQIYFVNQIIEYIVRNGVMKDMSVLQEPPFTDRGSIVEIFTDISYQSCLTFRCSTCDKNVMAEICSERRHNLIPVLKRLFSACGTRDRILHAIKKRYRLLKAEILTITVVLKRCLIRRFGNIPYEFSIRQLAISFCDLIIYSMRPDRPVIRTH